MSHVPASTAPAGAATAAPWWTELGVSSVLPPASPRLEEPSLRATMLSLRREAAALLKAADRQVGLSKAAAALVLYRTAFETLREAWALLGKDEEPSASPRPFPFLVLSELVDGPVPASVQRMVEDGYGSSPRSWRHLSAEELFRRVSDARAAGYFLLQHLPVLSPAQRGRRLQLLRWSACAALLVGLGTVGAYAFGPKNIARGKPVKTSGIFPASRAPQDGSGFVNGELEGAYGVHTNVGGIGWVEVDLQRPYTLSKAIVYNRGERPFQDEGLPLVFEVSSDGHAFEAVSTRSKHFDQSGPWKIPLDGRRARWVRIRNEKPGYVALSELEVYGRE